jgi:hypothetical protein
LDCSNTDALSFSYLYITDDEELFNMADCVQALEAAPDLQQATACAFPDVPDLDQEYLGALADAAEHQLTDALLQEHVHRLAVCRSNLQLSGMLELAELKLTREAFSCVDNEPTQSYFKER